MTGNDEPCYVIVGLGFSGVLDHLLLKKTAFGKQRVGGLPILHIGEKDPWSEYDVERMGQWPALLNLPGFARYHSGEPAEDFLRCQSFAEANKQELLSLMMDGQSTVWRGKVESIEDRTTEFLVKAVDLERERHEFRAKKIDICTGLGAPKLGCLDESASRMQQVLLGDVALHRGTKLGGSICVCGGPTAAWCVERALRIAEVTDILWVVRNLQDAFPVSRRNDGLVRAIVRRGWEVDYNHKPLASSAKLRIAGRHELTSLDQGGHES